MGVLGLRLRHTKENHTMSPKTRRTLLALTLGCLALAGVASAQGNGVTIEVTVTNLTSGQILSAPVVASHNASFQLFAPNDVASSDLAMLAEDAISGPLITTLGLDPDVFAVELGAGIPPGTSTTVTIQANAAHRWITVAGMLVTTNDAFYAVRGLRAERAMASAYADAWDSGSEANNEDCDYIPGPPCGNPGMNTGTPEGFIHIHNGIHGIGDLDEQFFDWRNPVAKVSVHFVPSGG